MASHTSLGLRMKENYENRSKTYLTRRVPVAIRVDGKAFHTLTRKFTKPYDHVMRTAMNNTMLYMCRNMQGCVLAFAQSDEITFILTDYKKLNSEAWFDYNVQKLCSISASMATMEFNNQLRMLAKSEAHKKAIGCAMFDARAFNIPEDEVPNLIWWRQQDAIRNSIQMLGQSEFSHKQLQYKSCDDIKKMLINKASETNNDKIIWHNQEHMDKYGTGCFKSLDGQWVIEENIPVFVGENQKYIESLVECKTY